MSTIFPSNTSTNKFFSPTNSEQEGFVFTVPVNNSATEDWQKNFALLTSVLLCNKTSTNIGVSAKLINGVTGSVILNSLSLPPNTSYDIISGNKITLKENDSLYVWHNSSLPNALDVVTSYTLHRPLTTYEI